MLRRQREGGSGASEKQIQIKLTNAWRQLGRQPFLRTVKLCSGIQFRVESENSICLKQQEEQDRNYKYFCGCHKWKFQLNTLLIFIVHPKSLTSLFLLLLSLLICLYLLQMVATDEQSSERQQHATDSGGGGGGGGASNTGALNKMKATLSSSLLTVTDKGEWEAAADLGLAPAFWGS